MTPGNREYLPESEKARRNLGTLSAKWRRPMKGFFVGSRGVRYEDEDGEYEIRLALSVEPNWTRRQSAGRLLGVTEQEGEWVCLLHNVVIRAGRLAVVDEDLDSCPGPGSLGHLEVIQHARELLEGLGADAYRQMCIVANDEPQESTASTFCDLDAYELDDQALS